MDIINQIISQMNKEEVRHFKLFTSRTQKDADRKDVAYFDYIRRSGEQYDEEKIFKKLYGDADSKNAFYRLKNRLLTDLNKSLVLQHMNDDDIIFILHLLSLARFFQTGGQYKTAFHYVKKAEKKALNLDHYELIDFIYTEMIKLSHEIISINPEVYILKRKKNRENLQVLREIDDILAAVTYRLKISQNFSPKNNPIFQLLEKTVDEYSRNESVKNNPKLRFSIYHSVSKMLLARKDYKTLEEYLLKTFSEFSEEGLFTKNNHDTKLQMLVYITNAMYHNEKPEESLKYAEILSDAMDEYNRMHYDKYLFFYYNALIVNYSKIDLDKAITILEELKSNGLFSKSPFYETFIYLNLSMSYYNADKFSKALKNLVQLYIHEGYKTMAESLRLKINVFELVLRLEVNDFDILEKRIEQVKRDFSEMINLNEYNFEAEMIRLIRDMNEIIDYRKDAGISSRVQSLLDRSKEEKQGDGIISYTNWLETKLKESENLQLS